MPLNYTTRVLINQIFDASNPAAQIEAAALMANLPGDSEIVHTLFRAAYEASNPRLQQEAVRSLGILCCQKALDAFSRSTSHVDPARRARAAYHLGNLGDCRGIEPILRCLADPDPRVRRAAAWATGQLAQDQRAIERLALLTASTEYPAVREMARKSIAEIRGRLLKATPASGFDRSRSFNATPGSYVARNNPTGFDRPKPAGAVKPFPESYRPKAI